jgi:secreted trypsin-like serine protease
MKTITIGERKLDSMTQDEFGDFVYRHGYCCSSEFWHPPVFTEFELYNDYIHFTFLQIGKCDQAKSPVTFEGLVAPFDERAHFTYTKDHLGNNSAHYLMAGDVAHFIKLGFHFPL